MSELGFIYHATNKDRLADIKEGTLDPHKPSYGTDQREWPDGSTARRSYFTKSPSTAYQFAPEDGKPVLLRVKDSKLFKTESTGDIYLEGKKIKPTGLEVLTTSGWKPVKSKG